MNGDREIIFPDKNLVYTRDQNVLTALIESTDLTESFIEDRTKPVIAGVLSGEIDPASVALRISAIMDWCKKIEANPDFKKAVIAEFEKYSKKDSKMFGCSFSTKPVPVKLDYSIDPEWARLQEGIDLLKKKQAVREEKMKLAYEAGSSITDKNGETFEAPPIKSGGGMTYAISHKEK